MLICYLGVKCTAPLLAALRERLRRVAEGEINCIEAVQFTFKLVHFLSICCSSPSPIFIGKLDRQDAGALFSSALAALDPKFRAKRLHLSLIALFGLLLASEINDLKQIYPSCGFIFDIYIQYKNKSNLLNSQCRACFTKIGSFCDQLKAVFVTNHFSIIQELRRSDPAIEMMVSNVFEDGERVREHFAPEKGGSSSRLLGDDEDIGLSLFLGE